MDKSLGAGNAFMTGSVFCLVHLVNDDRVHTELVVGFCLAHLLGVK